MKKRGVVFGLLTLVVITLGNLAHDLLDVKNKFLRRVLVGQRGRLAVSPRDLEPRQFDVSTFDAVRRRIAPLAKRVHVVSKLVLFAKQPEFGQQVVH